jgi:hypothetical protein
MITLREAGAGDREAILALRRRCFPDVDPEKQRPEFLDWEFVNGCSFIAEEAGSVISHLGFLRQPFVIDGCSRSGLLAVDAMTDPDHRGRRIFGRVAVHAAHELASRADFSGAWQIRKAVAGGIMSAGWQKAESAPVLVRPNLRIRRGARSQLGRIDVARMAEIAAAFFRGPHVDRTARWLDWRYLQNPFWRYDIAMTERAWLVTRTTRLKGIETLAVVDVAWDADGAADAAMLLSRALASATSPLAAALFTGAHPAFAWLRGKGFLPTPYRFNFLFKDFALGKTPLRWELGWGDTDHL